MEELVQICDHVILIPLRSMKSISTIFAAGVHCKCRDPREPGVLHTGRA